MKLSANQAAKESHKTKKTILDAIKSKRMSASKNDKGHWEIDASELFRVFPKTGITPEPDTDTIPPIKPLNTSVLEVELNAERQMRGRLESEIEDLRAQRDKWQVQAERLLLERPAQQSVVTPTNQNTPPEAEKRPRGMLARLFGG